MASTLSPGSRKKHKIDTGPGNYVMAELERRLKRRAVADDNSRLRRCHGDVVAPELSYQSQAFGVTSSDTSNSSLSHDHGTSSVLADGSCQLTEEMRPVRGQYRHVSTPTGTSRGTGWRARNKLSTTTAEHAMLSSSGPNQSENVTEHSSNDQQQPSTLHSHVKHPITHQLLSPRSAGDLAIFKNGSGVKELARAFSSLSKQRSAPILFVDHKKTLATPSLATPTTEEVFGTEMVKQRAYRDPPGDNSSSEAILMGADQSVLPPGEDEITVNRISKQDNKHAEPLASEDVSNENIEQGAEQTQNNSEDKVVPYTTDSRSVMANTVQSNPAMSTYMNVFDDNATCRPTSSTNPQSPASPKDPKKPIPTPRKGSTSSAKLSSQQPALDRSDNALHHVVNLPSLGETSDQSDQEESSHAHVTRSASSCSSNIRRRTTPKAQKELRKGIVTDGSIPSPPDDEDEYIVMNPTQRLELLSRVSAAQGRTRAQTTPALHSDAECSLRDRAESTTSTQSAYYLQVLPNTLRGTPPQSLTSSSDMPYPVPQPSTTTTAMPSDKSTPPSPNNEYVAITCLSKSTPSRSPESPKKSPHMSPRSGAGRRNRSQGSLFTREMLAFMDTDGMAPSANYSTAVTVSPVLRESGADSPTYIEWHEYVDVDPAELEAKHQQKVPPRVPPRPDLMPPRQDVMRPRPDMIPPKPEMAPPVPATSRDTKRMPYKSVTFLPLKQDSLLPPPPPPKTDSLLREQRALVQTQQGNMSNSDPRSLVKGRSQSNLVTSPKRSSSPSRAKQIIRALKREAFNRTAQKSRPNDSLLPPLMHRKPFHQQEEFSRLERSFSDPTLLEPNPSHNDTSDESATGSSDSLVIINRDDNDDSGAEGGERGRSETVLIYEEPLEDRRPWIRQHGGAIRNRINRDSLAVILKHRDVISEKLHPLDQNQLLSPDSDDKRGKETLIRNLGSILLEIDGLLRDSRSCTEEDLVSAIERELKIKLRECDDSAQTVLPTGTVRPAVDDDELTEQDVDDVIEAFTEEEEFSETKTKPHQSSLRRSHSDAVLLEHSSSVRQHRAPVLQQQDIDSWQLSSSEQEETIELDSEDEDTEEEEARREFTQSLDPFRYNRLHRANARRRPSVAADDIITTYNMITDKTGYVSHTGALLQNSDSEVVIEVPDGAVFRGKRQRLWFDVVQTVYYELDKEKREEEEEEGESRHDDGALMRDGFSHFTTPKQFKMESLLRGRAEGTVQLSPIVIVGPGDVMLNKPITVCLPHCLPADNVSWVLKVQGRAQNSEADEWLTVWPTPTTMSHSHKKRPYFRGASYQLHPNRVIIKTKQLGSFKLIGRPVSRSGRNVSKKMTCMVYSCTTDDTELPVKVKVVFLNAILDHIQAVDKELSSSGWVCVERGAPITCYGDRSDVEVTLLSGSRPIDTKIIPFGLIWRAKRVGQASAVFNLFSSQLMSGPFTSTRTRQFGLRVQQSSAYPPHLVNITIATHSH